MTAPRVHRLTGLEPDNLLAFMALLGLLRALGAVQDFPRARVAWSLEELPMRPMLHLERSASEEDVCAAAAAGVDVLARAHAFEGRADLNYSAEESRSALRDAGASADLASRPHVDLLAALMHDAALKDHKDRSVDPTPLCLLFGQGHQHFLERLAAVPKIPAPPPRGRGKQARQISASECIHEALFASWNRNDPTPSFRWDPMEDVRYATMPGDPTDPAFKAGTQHGPNRLAAIGLAALPLAATRRAGRVRPSVIGGAHDATGFSMAWPICGLPTSLEAIRALLSHPELRRPGALAHLGVAHVMVARRISVGKFMNFARARPT